jgi:hypothetical protein
MSDRASTSHGQRRAHGLLLLPTAAIGLMCLTSVGCSGSVMPNGDGTGQSDSAGSDGTGQQGGPGGNGPSACTGTASAASGRWRRLTALQYANSVRDLIGQSPDTSSLLADSRTGAFKTNALFPVQENDVGAYDSLAKTLSEKAVGNLNSLVACDTKATGEDKCAAQFIKNFGARAYRRPLKSDEVAAFTTVYTTGKEESFSAGIRLVVQAMLASPSFLYLVETGTPADNGLRKLTGYEVASRLSYVLTGTMPDSALFAEAEKGGLETPDGIRKYAQKLMASDKFINVAKEFHIELLGVDLVTSNEVSKGGKFASFDEAMRSAMLEEPRKFVEYVMTKGDGSIEEMLSGQYVFPTGPLAKVYGDGVKADGDGRALITNDTRRGILTLAGVQAAHPKQPSPHQAVNRGHLVRQEFLCETVPPPTIKVDFSLPPNAAQLTAQELLREHQENESCKGCHRMMDSIGFGFEGYDGIGAFRTKDEAGHTIDTSGEIVNLSVEGKFSNASEMASLLSKSPEVRNCMSTQWLRFALGRDPEEEDACSLEVIAKSFSNGKGNIKESVLSLVTSDAFRFNRGE